MKEFKYNFSKIGKILQSEIKIPEYQRTYDWKKEMIENLLEDLLKEFANEVFGKHEIVYSSEDFKMAFNDHKTENKEIFYLGQIVKQGEDIVDGQQRLTSIFIILKALADFHTNKVKLEEHQYSLFTLGGTTDIKLKSSNMDLEFSKKIQSKENLITSFKDKQWRVANQEFVKSIFFKNYKAAYESINDYITKELKLSKLNEITNFVENFSFFIREYIHVTSIEIEDVIDAVSFFEIMNSKSQPLTPADLIKNNFIKNSKGNKSTAAANWNEVEKDINDASLELSKYIRYVYICKHDTVSQKELFAKASDKNINIISDMKEYLDAFKEISGKTDSDDIFIDAQLNFIMNIGARESLTPIILEIFKSIDNKERKIELLNQLINFSYKFFFKNGFKANAYVNKVTSICREIANGSIKPLQPLFDSYVSELKKSERPDITTYDEEIIEFDKEDSASAKRFAKSIYPLIFSRHSEAVVNSLDGKEVKIKLLLDTLDVEHIYPQNPELSDDGKTPKVWPILADENKLWNIGNLLPISNSKNRAAKNSSFETKYNYYIGEVNSKGEKPTDKDEIAQLTKSPLFQTLFVNIVDNANSELVWSDEAIEKRGKKILELIKDNDILYLNSGNK